MKLTIIIIVLFTSCLFLVQCQKEEIVITPAINFPAGDGFELLSEYNFFKGKLSDLEPNIEAGVMPYDLIMPLFSDYALKKRFIYVPEGGSIPFDTSAVLKLPIGSILIKHFYFKNIDGSDQYIETRLMIRKIDGWFPEIYKWDEDHSDARRTIIGGIVNITADINGKNVMFPYSIPNQNQCKNCHAFNGKIIPIGPTIHNLNRDYEYASGKANQLSKWESVGILEKIPSANIPKWTTLNDENSSLHERARAYLAINCSSCHRREGSAANSGLYLEYDNKDSLSLGFWKTPIAAGGGSGGFPYVINPGLASESILLYRMKAEAVDERMPEIGRVLLHEEGIDLIRDWIDAM